MANQLFQISPLEHAFRKEQLYLVLYLHQAYAGTRQNQKLVVNENLDNEFGVIAVNDWPIYDSPELSKANMVACARGHHIQTSMDDDGKQYFVSSSIVFLDGSRYPGSTLLVNGMSDEGGSKGEWAIVGGTGKFTLAQGVVYYDVVKRYQGTGEMRELHIGAVYTPMERSTLGLMFSEFNPSEVDDATKNGAHVGQGGHGDVYKAEIRNRTVAVKVASGRRRREFRQEVEILSRFRHENLVTLIGACTKEAALFYEFLPNGTLLARLDRLDKEPFSFPWEERIRVAIDISYGLEFLHSARPPIVHGDLKPSNILFDAKGACKLGDFGISRLLEYNSDTTTPSHSTDVAKGTVSYIDPEFQITRKLTPYSDVYALGIILLQLVTGRDSPWKLREEVSGELGGVEILSAQAETICERLVDARLKLDDRSKQDAVRMIRLGLKCSNATRKERVKVATNVRPELESMKSGAIQDKAQPPTY